jgi:hypothetical protein
MKSVSKQKKIPMLWGEKEKEMLNPFLEAPLNFDAYMFDRILSTFTDK